MSSEKFPLKQSEPHHRMQYDIDVNNTSFYEKLISSSNAEESYSGLIKRPSIDTMMTSDFYRRPVRYWMFELCEGLFKIHIRGTTIKAEIYYGFIHYISCFFCLAVIPNLMSHAGYQTGSLFLITAVTCGVGSILGGLITNLPFVFAPPAVISIFLSSYLRQYSSKQYTTSIGSAAVIISGLIISLLGDRPVSDFIGRLIPSSIQVGTSIGTFCLS